MTTEKQETKPDDENKKASSNPVIQKKESAHNPQDKTGGSKPTGETNPPAPDIPNPPTDIRDERTGFFKRWNENGVWNGMMAIATALAFIAAVFVACFTYSLLNETRKQVVDNRAAIEEMQWFNRESLKRTDSSLTQTRASIALSEKWMNFDREKTRLELKPYFAIDGNPEMKQFRGGKKIIFIVGIKNVGRTPAFKVQAFSGMNFTASPDIKETLLPNYAWSGRQTTVSPNEAFNITLQTRLLLHPMDSVDFVVKEYQIFGYIRFVYTDVFNQKDTARFCVAYNAKEGFYFCQGK